MNMLLTQTVQRIVIEDNNGPDTLLIWVVMMLLIFIIYLGVGLIHDINREQKIERLKREREEQAKKKLEENDDI